MKSSLMPMVIELKHTTKAYLKAGQPDSSEGYDLVQNVLDVCAGADFDALIDALRSSESPAVDMGPRRELYLEIEDRQIESPAQSGWFIPLESMSDIAQMTFANMISVIKQGGSVSVVAHCDGKDFRWQCDGLKYAKRLSPSPATEEGAFTPQEVENLNDYQNAGMVHPFTCGSGNRCDENHAGGEGKLIATVRGWICPFCDYTQNWAHDFMKNGEWRKQVEATRSLLIAPPNVDAIQDEAIRTTIDVYRKRIAVTHINADCLKRMSKNLKPHGNPDYNQGFLCALDAIDSNIDYLLSGASTPASGPENIPADVVEKVCITLEWYANIPFEGDDEPAKQALAALQPYRGA